MRRITIKERKVVGCNVCGDSWERRPTPTDPKGTKLPLSCRFCRATQDNLYWVKEK